MGLERDNGVRIGWEERAEMGWFGFAVLRAKLHFWSMLKVGGGRERQGWGGEEPLVNNDCTSFISPCSIKYFSFDPYMQSKSRDF